MTSHASARLKYRRKLLRAHRLGEAGRFDDAEAIYRKYNAIYPQDPQVLFNLGVLMQRRAKDAAERLEAADFYHRAIASSDCEIFVKANAMNNLGLIMGKINQTEKAGICFGIALQMNPDLNAARINLADILRHDGKYEEADREFAEVLRLDPNSHAAKFSAGMIALMLGDMKRGWELYEARFGVDSFPTKRFNTDKTLWQNEELDDCTLLVWEEQGFGDTFQFCRYFRELKKRWPTSKIWFRGNILYRNIAKGIDGLDRFFAIEDELDPSFDFHCPLISLPHRLRTTLDTIPNESPYIHTAGWQPYLEASLGVNKRRIGLCWAGSPRHGKDAFRSLPPESFQPIIDAHPEIQFYSLQVGPRADEANRLRNIIDLAPTITEWTDSAQALINIGLLISVDTALIHLAGALDRPAWMLTPFSPDWRWMLTREDSPWYKKLRLFRQPTQNDWETPLNRINEDL